jgi:hypothetical protein
MQMQTEVRSGHGMNCTDAAEFTSTSFTRQKPAMVQLRCVAVPATCAQVCARVDVHVRLCVVWVAYLDRCPTDEALAARRVGKPEARLLDQVNAVLTIFVLGVRKRREQLAPLHKHEHTYHTRSGSPYYFYFAHSKGVDRVHLLLHDPPVLKRQGRSPVMVLSLD